MRGFVGHPYSQGGSIGVGIDGDARDIQFTKPANEADGDFTAIGDQDLTEHKGPIVAGYARNVTRVAPQPPASAGASPKDATKGSCSRTFLTILRCAPMPLPCMILTALNPARRASIKYSSTTGFTSRGETVWRSKTSSIGMRIGSFSAGSYSKINTLTRWYTLEL